jgi:membrane associated rhomboid family serine protease
MIIIPLTEKISWRNPPIITLGIILLNCLVFFLFQSDDTEKHINASEFYFTSGLAQIEVPRYIAYREGRLHKTDDSFDADSIGEDTLIQYYLEMQRDSLFLEKLGNDEIITPADLVYEDWKGLRSEYETQLSQIVSFSYGFRPAHKSFLTSFTYMFLHGSFMHLFGNMVFLWIVGCMLEMGLGRPKYLGLYIIGGLMAVWGYWLVYMDSAMPLVGASGSIAGLMGAYAVLFNKKKVKIFYSLGFYFNYLRIPAIILLPIWIGKEFYQLFLGGDSHVAYVAHIGGLVGGAVFGFICMKFSLGFDDDVIKEAPVDEIAPLIEKALKHIAELDLVTGRLVLQEALAKDPENIDALTHLFHVDKLDPESDKFHETAKKLIFQLSRSYHTYEKAHHIYQEYIRHTRNPRLTPQLYVQLSAMFAATGHIENAVKILTLLLKKVPQSPGIPGALLKLARAYRQNGMAAKGQKCLEVICQKYPNSTEAEVAARESLQN